MPTSSTFRSLHPAVSTESVLSSSPKRNPVEEENDAGLSPFLFSSTGFTPVASPDLFELCTTLDDNCWNGDIDNWSADANNNWDNVFFPAESKYL